MQIVNYKFQKICQILPLIDTNGKILALLPQSRYKNANGIKLNAYGSGPFCKFKIPTNLHYCGVYAITVDSSVKYMGECENLSSRYNNGYGIISPRNCFVGGQETNCRINNLVYDAAASGKKIILWFYKTKDYKAIEKQLRAQINPKWNRV